MSLDLDRLTPVEAVMKRRRIWTWAIALILLALAIYWLVFANEYVVAHNDDGAHFLHGSIGSETTGLPSQVLLALPAMYPERTGGADLSRFGLLYAEGDDLPIGFSRRVIDGVERGWFNCALCHVGAYRMPGDDTRHLIVGAPSNNLKLQELIQFLVDVGRDPGFTADALIEAINSDEVPGHLNPFERLVYRMIAFPQIKAGLGLVGEQLAFIERQQPWGPGRVDTFNPYKAIQFGFPMTPEALDPVALDGASDYPSLWMQAPREGMNLHWDGNNPSVAERNLSAALGAGVTPVTVDRPAIARIEAWMRDLPAPAWPGPVDEALAQQGAEVFAEYCAACHGMGGPEGYDYSTDRHPALGQVVPLDEIGTDPGRWASYTPDFSAAQNTLYAGYPWRFSHFRKTDGYANHPLDGIWARSPYLHNGAVPTLADLLEPAEARPAVWWRGHEGLDLDRVGYQSRVPGPDLFRYDTSAPGNSNAGHDYGTALPAAEKAALVEYMKTL